MESNLLLLPGQSLKLTSNHGEVCPALEPRSDAVPSRLRRLNKAWVRAVPRGVKPAHGTTFRIFLEVKMAVIRPRRTWFVHGFTQVTGRSGFAFRALLFSAVMGWLGSGQAQAGNSCLPDECPGR